MTHLGCPLCPDTSGHDNAQCPGCPDTGVRYVLKSDIFYFVLVTVFRVELVFPEESAVGINDGRVIISYERDNVGSFVGSTEP